MIAIYCKIASRKKPKSFGFSFFFRHCDTHHTYMDNVYNNCDVPCNQQEIYGDLTFVSDEDLADHCMDAERNFYNYNAMNHKITNNIW